MRFFNFRNIALVHIDVGTARILAVTEDKVAYVDARGVQREIWLRECAMNCRALEETGNFPPDGDLDWTAIAATRSDLAS